MQVSRCSYFVGTDLPKNNGMRLNSADLINVGYMAGRCGVSLDGDLSRNYQPVPVQGGVCVNINSCTKPLFEQNLVNAGIKFNVIA